MNRRRRLPEEKEEPAAANVPADGTNERRCHEIAEGTDEER
jgi:hypothetical protein